MVDENKKKIGSYKTLRVYMKSECVYDITHYFVRTSLDRLHDRTADQMLQAARSGNRTSSRATATRRGLQSRNTNSR